MTLWLVSAQEKLPRIIKWNITKKIHGVVTVMLTNECTECGCREVITDEARGEQICTSCGLVLSENMISCGKEWRSYNASEESDRSRVGAPTSPLDLDQGTFSSGLRQARDHGGTIIDSRRRFDFARLANLDRDRDGQIRNLRKAFRELQRLRSDLGLGSSVAQMASVIYRRSLKANLVWGRSIDSIIAASLYLACRKQGLPVALKDIQERANATPKELSRAVRTLLTELNIRPQNSSPESFVQKLADNLNMTMVTAQEAYGIVGRARDAGLTIGKNPMSVAAAALYIAGVRTGERRTQQQLATMAKTTPVTIRNRFKELIDVLGGFEDIEIKRGAGALPHYISDPLVFARQQVTT